MRVGILGCGLIGRKRAAALAGAKLSACADLDAARAQALAQSFGCAVCAPQELPNRDDVDVVIVATPNNALAECTIQALEAGCHVLVEKPAARNVAELERVREVARRTGRLVRVGFNHRYHPSFIKARELHREGILGPMMFIRAAYGHGGRLGYENEWRMQPEISGGGELIDQGVHLIDLSRCFLGEFTEITGRAETLYWDAPADDNAFMLLRTPERQTAFLHVSCSEWKNLFSFEIYGRNAKLHITGLGGSYGIEKLTCYRMLPEMGPPDTMSWEYPRGDASWNIEFAEFTEDIRLQRTPDAGLDDALAALRVVESIYQQSGSAS
ncbi:MAG: Gfo/Idh/MocA family oxidoreductase [Kiritimatiellae bacterium]|nr:Gfo/Idh/MocA family oxidoreductase [Kiritimatiellia bacterium]MDD4735971.1 Gfo/Idh/MocA family oxidoreductase [Kiritimatiellia bacterium]